MAEEWDPLADPPAAAQSGGDPMFAALLGLSSDDGLVPVEEGSKARIKVKDLERTFTDLNRKFARESPWKSMPESQPDLSWHAPSCTLEAWKHTDVKVELGPGIAYVTLNRPSDNNTLTDGVVAGLCDAVVLLHSRLDIRVAIFSGEGKMLSAGRDPKGDPYGFSIKAGAAAQQAYAAESDEAAKEGVFADGKANLGRLLQAKLWHAWSTLPQFTICLANGSALGDGMGPLLCSDMAVALNAAFFGFPDTKVGLVSAGLSPYLLAKTAAGSAKNMLVMGTLLSADAALEKGLVDRVVASVEEGHKVVKEVCAEISGCAPRAVQLSKELVMGIAGRQADEQTIFYTVRMASRVAEAEEAAQGLAAAKANGPKPWEASPVQPLH